MLSVNSHIAGLLGVQEPDDDWSFSHLTYGHTQYLTHFFHHWTAKFIPQIPQNIIREHGKRGDIVLDPFMGCGTTLVESKLLGLESYGIDINPLAVKIAKAKTSRIDDGLLSDFIAWLDEMKGRKRTKCVGPLSGSSSSAAHKSEPDDETRIEKRGSSSKTASNIVHLFPGSDKWFRRDVATALRTVLERIADYEPNTKNFIEVGLSDLLKGVSNARSDSTIPALPKSPQYIDKKHYNVLVDNETREIDVFQRLSAQLKRMQRAISQFTSLSQSSGDLPCHVVLGDSRRLSDYVEEANLIVTSPPYWDAQNYQKLHYLSFQLFGLEQPGEAEIGRAKNDYPGDVRKVTEEAAKILKGTFAIVIGESKTGQHEMVRDALLDCAMKEITTIKRRIINQAFFAKSVKHEYIYIFRN